MSILRQHERLLTENQIPDSALWSNMVGSLMSEVATRTHANTASSINDGNPLKGRHREDVIIDDKVLEKVGNNFTFLEGAPKPRVLALLGLPRTSTTALSLSLILHPKVLFSYIQIVKSLGRGFFTEETIQIPSSEDKIIVLKEVLGPLKNQAFNVIKFLRDIGFHARDIQPVFIFRDPVKIFLSFRRLGFAISPADFAELFNYFVDLVTIYKHGGAGDEASVLAQPLLIHYEDEPGLSTLTPLENLQLVLKNSFVGMDLHKNADGTLYQARFPTQEQLLAENAPVHLGQAAPPNREYFDMFVAPALAGRTYKRKSHTDEQELIRNGLVHQAEITSVRDMCSPGYNKLLKYHQQMVNWENS